jgi:predicted glycosyltransferase
VPALVVPYATPHEDEQTVRAARLARAGLARLLVEEAATPQRLAEEIRQTAGFTPAAATLDLNGAEQTTALLASMLASRESVCSS